MDTPNAAHFIYIPVMILLGVVIGWILGSRAARDAYLAEMRKREQRASGTQNAERRTQNLER